MSLLSFQRALCELIASPELCLAVRFDARAFLSRYELTQRERDRLSDIVWQRGMSTTCTIYRSNRVTPIYTLLHYTCVLLGDSLKANLEEFWANSELRDLEFKQEINRFSYFLKQRIADGFIADEYIEEVMDFELSVNELRFAPRRRILQELKGKVRIGGELRLHPLMRIVRFRHEPAEVLDALVRGRIPSNLPEREAYLLISVAHENLEATQMDSAVGEMLWRIQFKGASGVHEDLQDLLDRGFLCTVSTEMQSNA